MKIVCLVDDQYRRDLLSEHGISFYCETKRHKILFDLGQTDAFIKNAESLNIDLNAVDIVVVSHGHYDHGGGLDAFLKINKHAKVYIQSSAFNHFYSLRSKENLVYIGLNETLKHHPQIILLDGDFDIDDSLKLVNQLSGNLWFPKGNQTLFKGKEPDTFMHEQSLLISEDNLHVLLAGCAHHGILNIVKSAREKISDQTLDTVIGGFHLSSRRSDLLFSDKEIESLALALKPLSNQYVTGHCTGDRAYQIMDEIISDKLEWFYPGWFRQI